MVFMGCGQMTSQLEMGGRHFPKSFEGCRVAGGTNHTLLCTERSPWGFLELAAEPALLSKSSLGFFRSTSKEVKLPVNASSTSP